MQSNENSGSKWIEWARALCRRRRKQILYLLVGVGTTAVNYLVYAFLIFCVDAYYIVGNVLAWIAAVAFAYFANGAWVFGTGSKRGLKEALAFVASRLFSLGLETLLLYIGVSLMHIHALLAKIAVAIVVVVVNYLTGLLVYRDKGGGQK